MKKDLEKEIEIPEDVTIRLEGNELIVKGPEGENKRKFNFKEMEIKIEDRKIFVNKKQANKKDKRNINSTIAHITNLILGVRKKYEYVLEICSVHFPMNVKIEKDKLIIKNFLGERKERLIKIDPKVEIELKGSQIIIKSSDKEKAGLQATRIEGISRSVSRDKRIFQDGIWITKKEKGR